jgi:hypothetical protein
VRALLFVLLLGVLAGGLIWTSSSSHGSLRLPGSSASPHATPAEPAPHSGRLPRAHCRHGVPVCRAVGGRVVYVESVDPDGDGDLHVIVAAAGISAPGVTSIDIRRGLRPAHDPRLGSRVSAAGPVQRGHIGQNQIHALEVHFRP